MRLRTSRLLALLLLTTSTLLAETDPHHLSRPTPFVSAGANAFEEFGGSAVGGLAWENSKLFTWDEAGYETGGKSNDLVNKSHTGHDRYLKGDVMVKVTPWLALGPGCDWLKFYTPLYSKTHVKPRVGAWFKGGAYVHEITVVYVHPGTDWQNGATGAEVTGYWFAGRHFFYRFQVGAFRYHTTVTDRSNVPLTREQLSQHAMTGDLQALFGWRF